MKVPELYRDVCEACAEPCLTEVLRIRHETLEGTTSVCFCSAECLQQYYEVMPKRELDRRFRQEANFLYRLVCPACKSRFRRLVASGALDE